MKTTNGLARVRGLSRAQQDDARDLAARGDRIADAAATADGKPPAMAAAPAAAAGSEPDHAPQAPQATTLVRSQLAIIAVNTEDTGTPNRDLISFVFLAPVTSGTQVFFTDRAWNGTSFAAASAGEGTITYTAATDLAAGTVVTFSQSQLNAAGIQLTDAGETIYAYQGTIDAPSLFLHAVDIGDQTSGFDGNELLNTGLVNGTSAVALGTGAGLLDIDNAQFGGRFSNTQIADLFARINTASTWGQSSSEPQNGYAAGEPVFTAPDAVLVVGGGTGTTGDALISINLDGNYSTGSLGYQVVAAIQASTSIVYPTDVTLDTVNDRIFLVDSNYGTTNRILQGSISQLLANPGAAANFTVLYSNPAQTVNNGLDSLAIDPVNQRIYFNVSTASNGAQFARINYNTANQTPTVLATLGSDNYVSQIAIDFTRGEVFAASTLLTSFFGSDIIDRNYIYRASAGSAAALATATSLTFTTLPFSPNDTGQTGEGSPLAGNAFPVERGYLRGIDVDPVTHTL